MNIHLGFIEYNSHAPASDGGYKYDYPWGSPLADCDHRTLWGLLRAIWREHVS